MQNCFRCCGLLCSPEGHKISSSTSVAFHSFGACVNTQERIHLIIDSSFYFWMERRRHIVIARVRPPRVEHIATLFSLSDSSQSQHSARVSPFLSLLLRVCWFSRLRESERDGGGFLWFARERAAPEKWLAFGAPLNYNLTRSLLLCGFPFFVQPGQQRRVT